MPTPPTGILWLHRSCRGGLMLLAAVSLLLTGCQSSPHSADGRRVWSAKASRSICGGTLLVVFMPDEWPAQLPADEQNAYASWAGLLEEFVAGNRVVKEVRRADFRTADEVFYGRGLPVGEYTLLFVRADGMALYAAEPILDGAVYDYAEAFLAGRESEVGWTSRLHAGEDDAGMPRQLKLVRLQPMAPAAPPATPHPGPAVPPPAPHRPT